MSESLMTIENLNVAYTHSTGQVNVLRDLHLSLKKGESLCVVGESGSGKTTLLRSVQGVLASSASILSGSIIYDGQDLLKASSVKRRQVMGLGMGMVFQDAMTSLNPVRTVGNQIVETLRKRLFVSKKEAEERAHHLLKSVELHDTHRIMKAYPFQLSGGMRQRVLMALALSLNPQILIADEPTASLDVTVQKKMLRLMHRIGRENQMSLLMATHHLGLVESVADRVVVMYAGSVVENGPASDVLKNAVHPYTKALISAIPTFDDRSERLNVIPGMPPILSHLPAGCPFHPRCAFKRPICSQVMPKIRTLNASREVACHFPN